MSRKTNTPPPVSAEQIDAILPYLDAFERMGFTCGQWPDAGETEIPHFDDSDPVDRFVQALYDNEWIEPFDWTAWQDTAAQLVEAPEQLAAADAPTLRRLLTTHVRQDRACAGHLAGLFESGHIVAVLRRLKEIRTATKR